MIKIKCLFLMEEITKATAYRLILLPFPRTLFAKVFDSAQTDRWNAAI